VCHLARIWSPFLDLEPGIRAPDLRYLIRKSGAMNRSDIILISHPVSGARSRFGTCRILEPWFVTANGVACDDVR